MIKFEIMTAMPKELTASHLKKIERALSSLKFKGAAIVAVRFISLAEMRKLNRRAMRRDRPTDVLAFPSSPIPMPVGEKRAHLGDLAICAPYAKREAIRRGVPIKEGLARLLIHGTLHLFGFDHTDSADEVEMFSLQEKLLANSNL